MKNRQMVTDVTICTCTETTNDIQKNTEIKIIKSVISISSIYNLKGYRLTKSH